MKQLQVQQMEMTAKKAFDVMKATKAAQKRKANPSQVLFGMWEGDVKVQGIIDHYLCNGEVKGEWHLDWGFCIHDIRLHDAKNGNKLAEFAAMTDWQMVCHLRQLTQKLGLGTDRRTRKIIGVTKYAVLPDSMKQRPTAEPTGEQAGGQTGDDDEMSTPYYGDGTQTVAGRQVVSKEDLPQDMGAPTVFKPQQSQPQA